MATLTYTYPTSKAQALVDAVCWKFMYEAVIPGPDGGLIPNPETPAVFAKRMGAEFFTAAYRQHKEHLKRQQEPPTEDLGIA